MRNLQNLVAKFKTADANFPDGSAKDDVTSGDKTGTELIASWVNELLQAGYALIRNMGDVPDNVFEKPETSQIVDTFQKWFIRNAIINYRTLQNTGFAPTKMAISSDDEFFVCCGNTGLIIYSKFGETWESVTSGTVEILNDIEYDFSNGIFLIGGNGAIILTATDPTGSWTTRTPGLDDDEYHGCDIDETGDLYLLCGEYNGIHGITLSIDQGVNWDSVLGDLGGTIGGTTTDLLNDILAKGGNHIAVGDNGKIVKDIGGDNWPLQTSGTSENLLSIAHSSTLGGVNGRIVVTGETDTILNSDNGGVTWVVQTNPLLPDVAAENYNGIRWLSEANIFIITADSGIVIASKTGLDGSWVRLVTDTAIVLNDIAYNQGAGLAIIAGASGNVIQSHNVLP